MGLKRTITTSHSCSFSTQSKFTQNGFVLNYRKFGETYGTVAEEAKLLEEKVQGAGSHVMLVYKQRIAVSVADNPVFNDQETSKFVSIN